MREVSAETEDYAAAAQQIAAASQQLNASTEEISASASHLADAAERLLAATGRFTLDGGLGDGDSGFRGCGLVSRLSGRSGGVGSFGDAAEHSGTEPRANCAGSPPLRVLTRPSGAHAPASPAGPSCCIRAVSALFLFSFPPPTYAPLR